VIAYATERRGVDAASIGMGPSGFILFGLKGKMGSFGTLLIGIPLVGRQSGWLPGSRVAGQAPEIRRLDELSGCGRRE
jgi:hypothetical protein